MTQRTADDIRAELDRTMIKRAANVGSENFNGWAYWDGKMAALKDELATIERNDNERAG